MMPEPDSLAQHIATCSAGSARNLDGDITVDHGFMPRTVASSPLTGPHAAWEQVAARLPELAFAQDAQAIIADLPLLAAGPDDLPDDQVKRAATVLGLVAHSYWRFGVARMYVSRNRDIPDQLPPAITQPWQQVCHRLGRDGAGLTLEDWVFNNVTFSDPGLVGPSGEYRIEDAVIENLRPSLPVYDNRAEQVFTSAFFEINAAATPMVGELCRLEQVVREHGPDAHDEVCRVLLVAAECARRATKSFRRVSPRSDSTTFCDPVDWAKTLVTWTVPPPGYPTGPSGSATPLVHLFDALIGRTQYDSTLGVFAQELRGSQLPRKHRSFFDLVRDLGLRGYVAGLAEVAPARHTTAVEAFNDAVSAFAGDSGFLGVHKGKVVNYLGVGTIVGRNQSTAHDQTFIADATWTEMAGKLQHARDERTGLAI
ncbi:hypothetical protein AB0A63_12950 [Lentzea sp. NPDC042327]|uniref:hypothetical protein n=1 Tax=Lentzea sp. NPDC042327 TaxID=3154801 RepID=UPI0033E21995